MRTFLISLAAVGLLAGSACGGSSKKTPDAAPTSGAQPAAATIKAEGTTWSPDDITIKTGDVVAWSVDGGIVHDLRGDESVMHSAGSKFSVTHKFAKPGTFSYQCTIHPGMTGTITVS